MNYFQLGGLVTKNDPNTENCNLFFAEYLTLKDVNHVGEHLSYFYSGMADKWNMKRQVFNRRPDDDKRSVSHDEITGWLVSSKFFNAYHADLIWHHLITHFGSYNNTGKLIDYLPFNPANYYAWGKLCGSSFSSLFSIFYLINLLITCSKSPENTSSKLIYWVQLANIDSPLFKRLFEYKMKNMYGEHWLASLLVIYFGRTETEDFPIFTALKGFKYE